jgi:hypothetical protein
VVCYIGFRVVLEVEALLGKQYWDVASLIGFESGVETMFQTRENAQVPGAQQLLLRAPFASLTFSLPARQVSFGPPLASLTASAQLPVHTFGAAQVEPATGFNYPDEFCVLTKKHCPHLAGVG